jgi:hypothetical protein
MWWIGLPATIVGAVIFILGIRLAGGLTLGIGLVLIGLNVLINGELVAGPEPRPFSARGSVVRGHIEARTGMCDLRIAQCGPERIAGIVYGPFGKPGLEVIDGIAQIRLMAGFPPPITRWQSDLAGNVLWDADIRSFMGDLLLDLSALRFESLRASTRVGRLSVALPRRGYATMDLRNSLGDIEVFLPAETGVNVTVKRGPLSSVVIRDPRLAEFRPGHYGTPDYDSSPAQIELTITCWSGDITFLTLEST